MISKPFSIGSKVIGPSYLDNDKWRFSVWAPFAHNMELIAGAKQDMSIPMQKEDFGYWSVETDHLMNGTLYYYRIDNELLRPDPASLSQPQGVHGPSEIINLQDFEWQDSKWIGLPLSEMVIYELHVGSFTNEGTFYGVIQKLDYLMELGINAIEIMPVGQFPGTRNWGYDVAYPFAVQNSYGSARGLQNLVDTCHNKGIAVILDVIYNHLGPEGNYLPDYGPYLTNKYATPWGEAINFDDAYSDEVRNYYIRNALMWFRDFHIDALRLDAVHAIKDCGALHFMEELSRNIASYNTTTQQNRLLIAESDLNDVRYINTYNRGGYGLDAQWNDDFHHSLHALITSEQNGYYKDYGKIHHLAKSLRHAFVYDGLYSQFRKQRYGNKVTDQSGEQFIIYAQNHDQIGNRKNGERLSHLANFEQLKLAAGITLVSPYIPLLFMGEEYMEANPFLYFVDHSNPDLIKKVRQGRKDEFKDFHGRGKVPDPQSNDVFNQSRLQWNISENPNAKLLQFYKFMISLRKSEHVLCYGDRSMMRVQEFTEQQILFLYRWYLKNIVITICNFSDRVQVYKVSSIPHNTFYKILDSASTDWNGPGSDSPEQIYANNSIIIQPNSIVLYKNKT